MIIVRKLACITVFSQFLLGSPLGFTMPNHTYKDLPVSLVVGDQKHFHGTFDSQINFSKKGLVNIKWTGEQSFLLTALKSGVLIIDPTPISKTERRWLIKIKTPFQAKQDQKKQHTISQSTTLGDIYKLDPLKDQRFKTVIRQKSPHLITINCFHPDKKQLTMLLNIKYPERQQLCEPVSYGLELSLSAEQQQDAQHKKPAEAFDGKLPHQMKDSAKNAHYIWQIDIFPSLTPITYQMKHRSLAVQIKQLHFFQPMKSSPMILAFHYEYSVGAVTGSGYISKYYTIGDTIVLGELAL
ncbi:MAG: hypothetical protein OXC40_03205, partial [Proteobacteria bacterium]|nr:hypothetical protein [Pseudomonadota bacterium]